MMLHPSDIGFRRRLIARVEALRLNARITKLDFHQRIGPVASCFWRQFVSLSDEEAWQRFSLSGISRIADVLGVDAELLQFRS